MENERKRGRGWGGWAVGWGPAKELASQCARVCQNYPLAIYPLVSPDPRVRDAEMTIKIIFERSSQKGGSARGSKRGSTGDPS